jgi:hypothetical protein
MSVRNRKDLSLTPEQRMAKEVAEAEAAGDKFNLPSPYSIRSGDGPTAEGIRSRMGAAERKQFVETTQYTPQTAEEMRQARLDQQAADTSAQWQAWLKQMIREKKNIQREYALATGTNNVCPFVANINFASTLELRDEKAEIEAMKTFMNSETFAPWRERNEANAARYKAQIDILNFLEEWLKINYLDQGSHESFGIGFVLLHNAGFIPAPLAVPVAAPAPAPSALEQHIDRQQRYATIIVGNDEMGRNYTEADLDAMPAKEALRLRRLFEKGHRGNQLFDQFLDTKDAQSARDAELAKRVLAGK